ncbi:MAG TPA: ribbon-helix-helix protein, CopG family [Candidatus Dojkabacteria bacterium]|nr:ribbon-helix-helix protein, CopG family [Candidatus Dojkabacteria bacterium]
MKVKACFDIEEEDLEQIDTIAKKEERSRSFILRDAVRKYLERQQKR